MEELGIEPPKLGGDQGVENQKPVEETSSDPDLYTKYCKEWIWFILYSLKTKFILSMF